MKNKKIFLILIVIVALTITLNILNVRADECTEEILKQIDQKYGSSGSRAFNLALLEEYEKEGLCAEFKTSNKLSEGTLSKMQQLSNSRQSAQSKSSCSIKVSADRITITSKNLNKPSRFEVQVKSESGTIYLLSIVTATKVDSVTFTGEATFPAGITGKYTINADYTPKFLFIKDTFNSIKCQTTYEILSNQLESGSRTETKTPRTKSTQKASESKGETQTTSERANALDQRAENLILKIKQIEDSLNSALKSGKIDEGQKTLIKKTLIDVQSRINQVRRKMDILKSNS